MLRAHLLAGEQEVVTLDGAGAVQEAVRAGTGTLWVDLEGADVRQDLEALAACLGMDTEVIDDCVSGAQRPRVDEYDEFLVALLYDPSDPARPEQFDPAKLAFVLGTRFLVTIHERPLACITNLRGQMARRGKALLRRGADHLFFMIVDAMVDGCIACAEAYEDRLDALEEQSLSPDSPGRVLLGELSDIRREVAGLRRLVLAQREAVGPFAHGGYAFIDAPARDNFAHVSAHLTHAVELTDALRDITHGVLDNHYAMQGERTNAFMRTLTLFATLTMPLSLIAGIYGMNLVLWPPQGEPLTTVLVLSGMVTVVLIMLLYFRRRNWL
jgi:magnesium transporter